MCVYVRCHNNRKHRKCKIYAEEVQSVYLMEKDEQDIKFNVESL